MESILARTAGELRDAFGAAGVEPFRASQVLGFVYRKGVCDWASMPTLGRAARERLAGAFRVHALERKAVYGSADGTQKLVLVTEDGHQIESVIIPEDDRRTLCVSSQVGCSLDCSFCATGRMGLGRNLRADEIVDQWLHASQVLGERGEVLTNIVFMGMGEPLLNLRNVVQAIRVLSDPLAGCLSPRRITVSTSGVVPRMADLGNAVPVRLAVSLHATTDAVRDVLVPLNRRFPIAVLLEACRNYPVARRDRISFEYILIDGVNDSAEDAERLRRLLRGLPAKVNLIPMNEHPGAPYRRPSDAAVDRFGSTLARAGMNVSVRRSRGDDIFAACGQLGALAPRETTTDLASPVR
jgi:23S rRNA (adenine2503-C2)-methyltransferase